MTARRLLCASCGKEFTARRPTAKFCKPACRTRAYRAPGGSAGAVPGEAPARRRRRPLLAGATRAELAAAGRQGSAAGIQALMLARRLDDSAGETLAAVASAMREHAAAMERALRGAAPDDPVQGLRDRVVADDEVGARRDRRSAAGS